MLIIVKCFKFHPFFNNSFHSCRPGQAWPTPMMMVPWGEGKRTCFGIRIGSWQCWRELVLDKVRIALPRKLVWALKSWFVTDVHCSTKGLCALEQWDLKCLNFKIKRRLILIKQQFFWIFLFNLNLRNSHCYSTLLHHPRMFQQLPKGSLQRNTHTLARTLPRNPTNNDSERPSVIELKHNP